MTDASIHSGWHTTDDGEPVNVRSGTTASSVRPVQAVRKNRRMEALAAITGIALVIGLSLSVFGFSRLTGDLGADADIPLPFGEAPRTVTQLTPRELPNAFVAPDNAVQEPVSAPVLQDAPVPPPTDHAAESATLSVPSAPSDAVGDTALVFNSDKLPVNTHRAEQHPAQESLHSGAPLLARSEYMPRETTETGPVGLIATLIATLAIYTVVSGRRALRSLSN